MTRKLSIAILLPEVSARPIGGAKALYRYADELAAAGNRVALVHPRESLLTTVRERLDRDISLFGPAPRPAVSAEPASRSGGDPRRWYSVRPDVEDLLVPDLEEVNIRGAFDVTMATNLLMLPIVQGYSERMGRKVYFLLDYESYMVGSAAEREKARRAIPVDWPVLGSSRAVQRLVESAGGRCQLITRAIDTGSFSLEIPIESSARTGIGFSARSERTKRTADAIRALELARPSLGAGFSFWCFGYEAIQGLPAWILQYVAPSDLELRDLYNRSAVFLVASDWEGFGQPGAEAMACGAALVSTRNGGVDAFAEHMVSAVLCGRRQPSELAEAVVGLASDGLFRQRIARNGHAEITRRDWVSAGRDLERVLMSIAGSPAGEDHQSR